jgi:drug/metabolite transporter (DMT)-like permease
VDAVLALVAAVSFGSSAVAIRIGQRRVPDVAVGAVATVGIALALAVSAAAIAAPERPDLGALWPFVLAGAAVPGATTFLFQWAVQEAGAARPTVVLGTTPLLSVLLAAAFLDEQLDAIVVAGTLLVVGGAVVLARERGRPAHVRVLGFLLAGVCAAMFAGRDIVVRAVARDVDVPPLHAGAGSLLGAAAAVVAYLLLRRQGGGSVRQALRPMLPAGLSLGIAYLALVAAYDAGPVTTVAPLVGTQPLWAVLIASVVLRRSEAVGARLVAAAALVVAGGGLIGAAR